MNRLTAHTDVARSLFEAYLAQDGPTAEALLAPDLSFTSPQDDHIDRNAYFDRCFPTTDRIRSQVLLHVVDLDDDHVVIVYEYELITGGMYRNSEVLTVRGGVVHEIQVFFGGRVH